MTGWSFLTNHARTLLYLADNPDSRLKDIADALDVTERTVFSIVGDLTHSGYIAKEKRGRRNVYQIRGDLPVPESIGQQRAVSDLLNVFLHD